VSKFETHVCDVCNTPAPPSGEPDRGIHAAAPGWLRVEIGGSYKDGLDLCSWACLAEHANRQAGEQRHPSTSKRRAAKAAPVVELRRSSD
jgi:hypothetical protein